MTFKLLVYKKKTYLRDRKRVLLGVVKEKARENRMPTPAETPPEPDPTALIFGGASDEISMWVSLAEIRAATEPPAPLPEVTIDEIPRLPRMVEIRADTDPPALLPDVISYKISRWPRIMKM